MGTLISETVILAEQGSAPSRYTLPDADDDTFILVKCRCYKTICGRSSPGSPYRTESQTIVGDIAFWFKLLKLKNIPLYRYSCTTDILDFLSSMNVPQDVHELAVDKVFNLVDEAVSLDLPIYLDIFDMNFRVWEELSFVPATRESIQGLERVRLDHRAKRRKVETSDGLQVGEETCAICWESYNDGGDKEQVVNRLPCGHCYHGDCIVQWLKINHLCPLCRFAMPSTPC